MPAVNASRPLGSELFTYFGFPSRRTGRISTGPNDHLRALSSDFVRRARSLAHSADETDTAFGDDQATATYSFPMYSLASTFTGPFHFFSEFPNLLWSLE